MADRFPISVDELVWDFVNLAPILGYSISEDDISREVSKEIVTRYERDLGRMEDPSIFHEGGFLTFWIKKLKPIMREKKSQPPLNEYLAILIGIYAITTSGKGSLRWKWSFVCELASTLRYEPASPHMISWIYKAIWEVKLV